jgi:VWFA-related protein
MDTHGTATTILVHSDLVLIPVTVTDGKGRIVGGLEKEHFTLYEDKVAQEITHFAAEDAPFSMCLVFDSSDSMGPKMAKAREAVAALLDNAHREDEFCLVQFNQHPQLVVPLTKQSAEVRSQMERVQTSGSTALLDAVTLALGEMRKARYTRRAIIIISDGEDNSSHTSVSQLKDAVRGADVLIYAIGIVDIVPPSSAWPPPPRLAGSALLSEIAKQTGGRLFEVDRLKQLPEIASKIGSWLRSQYMLGYTSNNSERNGEYRRIQVKLTRPKGTPRLHAFWRLGYYAPSE